jgi:hypothetical protein
MGFCRVRFQLKRMLEVYPSLGEARPQAQGFVEFRNRPVQVALFKEYAP